MSDKSSPLKRLVIEINVWVKLPEEEKYFYPITDTYASDPTLIDCMERVSCESLRPSRFEAEIPTWSRQVTSRGASKQCRCFHSYQGRVIPETAPLRRNLFGDVKIPKVDGS
ncbi:hypothetical protein Tco_0981910 [Tanacetum coccineum]